VQYIRKVVDATRSAVTPGMSRGPESYLGTLVAGCPNFFILFGPNTKGVNSILCIHEVQTRFIRHLIERWTGAGVRHSLWRSREMVPRDYQLRD
jgi:hypothetical protein